MRAVATSLVTTSPVTHSPLPATNEPLPALEVHRSSASRCVVGLVYTLPNFFPEVPAVQVSSSKATVKIDTALLATRRRRAEGGQHPVSRRRARPDRHQGPLRRPRHAAQGQGRAADEARRQLHRRAEPAVARRRTGSPSIGALPMYLGLDLRGGVHFLLQVDMKAALDKAADRYTTDIRSLLREKKVQYSGIAREGAERRGALPRRGERATRRARRSSSAFPDLRARAGRRRASSRSSRALKPEAQKRIQDGAVQQNITILRNRVNELGVAEPIIQQQGADRVVVQLPGVQDTARAKDILGRTATLEIRMVERATPRRARGSALRGQRAVRQRPLHRAQRRSRCSSRRQVVLTGDRINDAQPGFDQRRQRARRARQPRRHRRAHLQARSRARTSASAWRSCWSRRARPR